MITVDEFMKNNNINNRKKVERWIKLGFIPGVKRDKNGECLIPSLARPPYTATRAKTVNAIYLSIVNACNKRLGVCSSLYKIPEEEFSVYISNLAKEGLISVKEEDGAEFYFSTLKSEKFIYENSKLKKMLDKVVPSTIKILADMAIKKALHS